MTEETIMAVSVALGAILGWIVNILICLWMVSCCLQLGMRHTMEMMERGEEGTPDETPATKLPWYAKMVDWFLARCYAKALKDWAAA